MKKKCLYPKCHQCPLCGEDSFKVINHCIPMRICVDPVCSRVFGFWAFTAEYIPFTGYMLPYEGSYIIALYQYLKICIKDMF